MRPITPKLKSRLPRLAPIVRNEMLNYYSENRSVGFCLETYTSWRWLCANRGWLWVDEYIGTGRSRSRTET